VEEKKRYTPFPKKQGKRGGINAPLDYDKLRELYLDSPHYDWTPFCKRHNFHAQVGINNLKKNNIDFKDWKREWLKRQAQNQDEELAPEILDLRKAVSLQRIKFVKDWTDRTKYMKVLLDAMLKRHGDDLQHDMENAERIRAGHLQKKFKLESDELDNIAGAAARLQEIETRALMLTSDKFNQPHILAGGGVEHEDLPHNSQYKAPELEVVTMGAAGLSAAETAKLLSQWFDQADAKPAPILVNGSGHAKED
jgi:hypothetical protein